jgi:hypothetical protein
LSRFCGERGIDRMIGAHNEIRSNHLPRIPLQPLAHPVAEKSDARERGNRQHEREDEHGQLARAPVACGHSQ